MSALLCRTITTWVEPEIIDHIPLGHLIEPSERLLHKAPYVEGKKVFLYRQLPAQIGAYMQLGQVNLRRRTEDWVTILKTMKRSSDMIWIESNDFFRDVRGTIDTVTDHLQIPRVKNINWANHNVKLFVEQGLNYAPIQLPEAPQGVGTYTAIDGVIDFDNAMSIPRIAKLVDEMREKYPSLREYM
tara:strand:+ start:2524 stop:3081 length:558 start_codon:yes stop_codon:yes gene_type:complete